MQRLKQMIHLLLLGTLLLIFLGLCYVIVSLQGETQSLAEMFKTHIEYSGVTNPVTAVLMNFRAYDTFLEMCVLFVALLGTYTLSTQTSQRQILMQSSILKRLGGILVPLLLLLSLYLLWAGGHAPGGAFQAGSIASAAWMLLYLSGQTQNTSPYAPSIRLAISISLLLFVAISIVTLLLTHTFLGLPPRFASLYIFLLEAVATLSIGVTLLHLFLRIFQYEKEAP